MARFRYRLQNILNIKEKLETQARQQFADAKRRLDEEEEKLRLLREKKLALEEEARRLLTGTLDFHEIDNNQLSRIFCDQQIAAQEEAVARAVRNLDLAREALEESVKERKIHEKLREKAFEEFLQEENRAESKVIDELTTYTYGQKKKN